MFKRELAEEARLKVSEISSVELHKDFSGFNRGAATLVLAGDTQRLNDLIKQAPEMYDAICSVRYVFAKLKNTDKFRQDQISDEATKHKLKQLKIKKKQSPLIVCPKEFLKPYFGH